MLCRLIVVALAIVSAASLEPAAATNAKAGGCPLGLALFQLDNFMMTKDSDNAGEQMALLQQMRELTKSTVPGRPLANQLNQTQRQQFGKIRFQMIVRDSEHALWSKYQRDAHVIANVAKIVELADHYEVNPSQLPPKDPRQFYFSILALLRRAEPVPNVTPLMGTEADCTVGGGLYFQEQFYRRQLNTVADPKDQLAVADFERLRTFQRLCWALLNLAMGDLRQARESSEQPVLSDNVTPGVARMDDFSREMYANVIPFVDRNMPSEAELAAAYQAKLIAQFDAPSDAK